VCSSDLPAFPATSWTKDGDFLGENQGMTLRDYFAAKALPQALAEYATEARKNGFAEGWRDCVAMDCYSFADAMMKARLL
jgi:hypothetical protein